MFQLQDYTYPEDNKEAQVFMWMDHPIRAVNQDDEVWFVAKDICEALDVDNSRQALTRLDEDEKLTLLIMTSGQRRQMKIISLSGLIALTLTSRKEEAKPFQRWVRKEVVPKVLKTGSYGNTKLINSYDDVQTILLTANNEIEKLKTDNKKLLPKAQTWDYVCRASNCITFTTLAKMIPSIKTPDRLKQILKNKRYLHKNGSVARKGYEIYYRPHIDNDERGYMRSDLGITPAGIEFTLDRLNKANYLTLQIKEGVLAAFKDVSKSACE